MKPFRSTIGAGRSLSASFLLLVSCLWFPVSPSTHALVDTNGNGVSDLWEQQFNNG